MANSRAMISLGRVAESFTKPSLPNSVHVDQPSPRVLIREPWRKKALETSITIIS